MLQTQTVERKTLQLIKELQNDPVLSSTRLVGGTSLSLQIAHRISTDIDLFTTEEINGQFLSEHLQHNYDLKVRSIFGKSIIGTIDDVKVDVIYHPYIWIEEPIYAEQCRLAGLKDIAAMKMHAIANSGTRPKDFVDLAYLGNIFSFHELLNLALQKYPKYSLFVLSKAFNYFDDVDKDAISQIKMLNSKMVWNEITKRLEQMINHPETVIEKPVLDPLFKLFEEDRMILKNIGVSNQELITLQNAGKLSIKIGNGKQFLIRLKTSFAEIWSQTERRYLPLRNYADFVNKKNKISTKKKPPQHKFKL